MSTAFRRKKAGRTRGKIKLALEKLLEAERKLVAFEERNLDHVYKHKGAWLKKAHQKAYRAELQRKTKRQRQRIFALVRFRYSVLMK